MSLKVKINLSLIFCLMFLVFINGCKKEKDAVGTDKELYDLSKATSGFVWYKNSSEFLTKSSGSGHPQSLLRTRYNSIAATQLDSLGKVKINASFPEGSLIVKELHDKANSIERYAILFKNSKSSDADAKGWVWGYINSKGGVVEAASQKGISCIGCHSQSDNIDYMLMNKYFP